MTKMTTILDGSVAKTIRDVIAKIPPGELPYAKPGRVLPVLEKSGIQITPSVRSATSKLLGIAKKMAGKSAELSTEGKVITFDPNSAQRLGVASRSELAMRLVEACDGDFELVRAEIDRLEKFAQKIRKA